MADNKSTFLIASLLVLLWYPAAISGDNLNAELKKSIVSTFGLDTTVTEVEIRRNRIEIAPDEYDSVAVMPLTDSEPRGLLSLRVEIYKGGAMVESGQIRVKINVYNNVLVTTDRIRRHDIITSDKCKIERMEITSLTEKPITSEEGLSDRWAKRSIGKGQILTSGMLERIPTITSGQEVSILYRNSLLEISARGVALEQGYTDDVIRVRNLQSREVITGAIRDNETIEVTTH
jgi:flagella basal body P-ring formation protein FlgA